MAILDRAQLKALFKSGLRPTEANFADLIDSLALTMEIPAKPYKVFSALLRIENLGSPQRPRYVVNHTLLEANTIGELTFSIVGENQINIENSEGLLIFEKRFLSIGTLRLDYNFDSIYESDEIDDDSIKLIFNFKENILVPVGGLVPAFYNLPIEIRIYDELEDQLPFPGGPVDPGIPLPNPVDSQTKS